MKKKKTKPTAVKIILGKLGDNGFHLFIPIDINKKKCRFLIDTGASKSVIDKSYFEKHCGKENLQVLKQETAGLHNSVSESHCGVVDKIKIGKQSIKDYSLAVIDLSHVNSTYRKMKKPRIQGILGSDLMLKYKMIVDYSTMQIVLN